MAEQPHPARDRKSLREIAHEWDEAAADRVEQIASGDDLSYHSVLVPAVDRLRRRLSHRKVLDAGCGTGYLTHHLALSSQETIGVDISGVSIDLARTRYARSNVVFVHDSVEGFSRSGEGAFTLVVANMVLMTAPNLWAFVRGVARLMRPGGSFIFTIPHPWFWPSYWRYDAEPWFSYSERIPVEAPFKISLLDTDHLTTHFHRPLSAYVEALRDAGLVIVDLDEPLPSKAAQAKYPEKWTFPRFLIARAVKRALRPGDGE